MSRGWTLIALTFALGASAAPAAAQDAVDTTKPTLHVDQPDPSNFTRYQQLHPYFSGQVSDDSPGEPTITITIFDPSDAVAAEETIGPRSGWWGFNFQWADDPPLDHGVEYRAEVVAEDAAGNKTTVPTSFKTDGVAPTVTIAQDPGAETTDSTPFAAGSASRDDGDRPFVTIDVLKREGPGWMSVARVDAHIGADGQWSGEVSPAVAPGDYVMRYGHVDMAMNGTVIERPLRVIETPPPQEPPPPPPPPLPPPVAPPALAPPTGDTGLGAAASLRRSALRSLRSVPIRRFLRRGARVPVAVDQPGTAAIQLFTRRAASRAARTAARRLVARGRRTLDRGSGTVAVRPTKRGRRILRRSRRARLTVRVRFAPASGAPVSLNAPLTLRR